MKCLNNVYITLFCNLPLSGKSDSIKPLEMTNKGTFDTIIILCKKITLFKIL